MQRGFEVRTVDFVAFLNSGKARRTQSEETRLRIEQALTGMPEHVSVRDIAEATGLCNQTIWHRICKTWKLSPVVKRGSGGTRSPALYSRDQILKEVTWGKE